MTGSNIEETLKRDGVYISTTSGVSMYPMLRHRRDTITVTPSKYRLEKYDVALFRRGKDYVLHRVVKVLPDSYLIRGDNCIACDHVPDSDILGKLTEVWRADRKLNMNGAGYKLYSRFITFIHPIVSLKLKVSSKLCRGRR